MSIEITWQSHMKVCPQCAWPSQLQIQTRLYFSILILHMHALISQSPPSQFSLDTSNRNVLLRNDLHVFYRSCPNTKSQFLSQVWVSFYNSSNQPNYCEGPVVNYIIPITSELHS